MSYAISTHGSIWAVEGCLEGYEAAGNLFPTEEAAQEELARRIAVWNERYSPPTNKQVSIIFEVKAVDEPQRYTWTEAMAAFDDNQDSPWRLPTKTELAIMYETRKQIGGFTSDAYWSSSESISSYSWIQQFSDGAQLNYFKSSSFAVRAVRKKEQQS